MVAWIMTIVLAAVVARIVYLEKQCNERSRRALAKADEQIALLMKSATVKYRVRYGQEPVELKTHLQFKAPTHKTAARSP